jgi:hypothetical protein
VDVGIVEAGQDQAAAGVDRGRTGVGQRANLRVGPGREDSFARDGERRPAGLPRPDSAIQDDDRGLSDDAGDRSRLRTD